MNHSSNLMMQDKYSLSDCGNSFFHSIFEQMGWMFYLISPWSSAYESPHQVPNYEVAVFPAISILVGLEQFYKLITGKKNNKLNDIIVNMGAGYLFVLMRVLLLSTVLDLFYFLYNNYRIVDLPKTAYSTWFLSLLLVEFIYYWVHRCLHEINLFWASHQFHHNATELDISTTIRDTIVDLVIYEFFPAPLALIIPPPILLVHMQFSLIYQVWLHNEVVAKLGWLECLINTPSQHRVHHGKNPHCIDKNFGALIMIYDRIFGTYQSDDQEKIVFGTTTKPFQTFDTITLHFYYYYTNVWLKFKQVKGVGNKLAVLFYGPGWAPGKPRLGLKSDLLPVDQHEHHERWEPNAPFWHQFYVLLHGLIITFGVYIVTDHPLIRYSHFNALVMFLYVLAALTTFGCIFDRRPIAPIVESIRCLAYFLFDSLIISTWLLSVPMKFQYFFSLILILIRIIHIGSIIMWVLIWLRQSNKSHNKLLSNYKLEEEYDEELNKYDLKKTEMTYSHFINENHRWKKYQRFIISMTLILSIVVLMAASMFQLKECQHLIEWNHHYEL